jgi:hypothetical protein
MNLRNITQSIVSMGTAIVNQNTQVVYTSGKIRIVYITDIIRFGYNLARQSKENQADQVCLSKPIPQRRKYVTKARFQL